jgi:hypothetical protein
VAWQTGNILTNFAMKFHSEEADKGIMHAAASVDIGVDIDEH